MDVRQGHFAIDAWSLKMAEFEYLKKIEQFFTFLSKLGHFFDNFSNFQGYIYFTESTPMIYRLFNKSLKKSMA